MHHDSTPPTTEYADHVAAIRDDIERINTMVRDETVDLGIGSELDAEAGLVTIPRLLPTPVTSRFLSDYLAGAPALAPFYSGHPLDPAAYERKALEADRKDLKSLLGTSLIDAQTEVLGRALPFRMLLAQFANTMIVVLLIAMGVVLRRDGNEMRVPWHQGLAVTGPPQVAAVRRIATLDLTTHGLEKLFGTQRRIRRRRCRAPRPGTRRARDDRRRARR